jgi:SNF2 family DNA or RNA helicase
MGKTVEMLSLILSNPPPAYWETSGGAGKRVGATLVIVPTALLDQWVNEGTNTNTHCSAPRPMGE